MADQHDKLESGIVNQNNEHKITDSSTYNYPAIRTSITINHKFNARHTIRAGAIYSDLFYDVYGKAVYRNLFSDSIGNPQLSPTGEYVNHEGKTALAEAFFAYGN